MYEKFYGKITDTNTTLRVTVPTRLCKFMGLKQGDDVEVMIKKVEKAE